MENISSFKMPIYEYVKSLTKALFELKKILMIYFKETKFGKI